MEIRKSRKSIFIVLGIMLMVVMTVPVHAAGKYITTIYKNPIQIYVRASTTLKPKNPAKGEKLVWTSANRTIAVVSSTGRVTGKKAGTIKIKAKSKSRSYSYIVKISNRPKISCASKTIEVGDSFTLKLNNVNTGVTWNSKNKKVAMTNYAGQVSGYSVGTTYVYTKYNGITYTCKVTVKKSSKSMIRKAAPLADECVLKAFEDLGFKLKYDNSVSYAGYFSGMDQSITLQESGRDTVYHELGHFLAWVAGNVDKKAEFNAIYTTEKSKYTGVRKAYVTQNTSEYFAESYRDYILSGTTLKKQRPKTYQYVKNAVQTIKNSPDRISNIKKTFGPMWKKRNS